jgi:HEAT repeat protein
MGWMSGVFGKGDGPSDWQLRRALKKVIQTHGDPSIRVGAMERLSRWGSEQAAANLLRRFTIQVPQASMDLEEKQYAVRLLSEMGRVAVPPILRHLQSEGEVTFPLHALRAILPPEEYLAALKDQLERMASGYARWPEARKVLVESIPDEAFDTFREVVLQCLADDDDDVCIAAADWLARNGDESVRERLLLTFLDSAARPRVRGRILDHLCEKEWPVKGYRKRFEEAIQEPFYLTARGTVKRRPS